jgi:hypothetical protein
MIIMHLTSLPDLVLLDIFSYLSCEDALYSFAELNIFRLVDLLVERGAFRHICLSSALPFYQYTVLAQRIWCFNLVRSLVIQDAFIDIVSPHARWRLFPSLIDLRLLHQRCIMKTTIQFVIAHASTLTHLTLTTTPYKCWWSDQSIFLHAVLPHLHRLVMLQAYCTIPLQVHIITFD